MKANVLADFGSTYTKVTLVESDTGRLLARGQAPTTVAVLAAIGVGVLIGLVNAVLIEWGLNPLATTIGMLTALSGVAALMSGDEPVLLSAAGNLNCPR